jgi:hypothetical protein
MIRLAVRFERYVISLFTLSPGAGLKINRHRLLFQRDFNYQFDVYKTLTVSAK